MLTEEKEIEAAMFLVFTSSISVMDKIVVDSNAENKGRVKEGLDYLSSIISAGYLLIPPKRYKVALDKIKDVAKRMNMKLDLKEFYPKEQ